MIMTRSKKIIDRLSGARMSLITHNSSGHIKIGELLHLWDSSIVYPLVICYIAIENGDL